jgi:RHS repeat-associated protein
VELGERPVHLPHVRPRRPALELGVPKRVSVIRKDQTFDYASRITAINDPNNSATNQSYTYDVLDRLTQGQTASPATHTQQFTYDAIGNRQTAVLDSTSTSYGYVSGSNRLSSLSGGTSRSYTYDAVGNPTTVGALTYIYNNANRLVQVKNGSTVIASYEVNALGQRTRKTVGATITRFIYDEKGHLIGEYDDSGNLIQETVWLDELPVATLRPTGSSGTPTPINTYYVHADHLGSPRAVTRPSDNAFTWKWDQLDPFGANVADENPASLGSFMHALRFPGQYYDAETGTNYNYKRDYDAAIGRYLQSDPIGLDGGVNTYAYAKQNPLHFTDPSGQFAVIAPILECLLNPVCAGGVFAIIGVGSQIGSQSGANSGSSSNCPPDDPCDKKLSKHEIEKLQKGGVDVEGEKEGYGGPPSHFDLYKCKNGDIVVKRKGGGEIVARTGLNMNNF